MTEEEYEKKVKGTKTFCIIIGILFAIVFFMSVSQKNITTSILSVGFIILLVLFYLLTKKRKIAGPIIGIILGIVCVLLTAAIIIQVKTVRNSGIETNVNSEENELRDEVLRWKEKADNASQELTKVEKELEKQREKATKND